MLSRALAEEVTAFATEIDAAVSRGEMTLSQAEAMGHMLGVRHAKHPSASARSLQ
jgi:hypothetical protein